MWYFRPLCYSKIWRWVCKCQGMVEWQKLDSSLQCCIETNQKEGRERDQSIKDKNPKWHAASSSLSLNDLAGVTWGPCLVKSQHTLLRSDQFRCPLCMPACRKFACPTKQKEKCSWELNKNTMNLYVQVCIKACEPAFITMQVRSRTGTLHINTLSYEH